MSFYRRTIWYLKGSREYVKNGYENAAKSFNENDLKVDCSGKNFMITGANSGIGKSIATEIAKLGGSIHMVCRNDKTANEAKEEIVQQTGNNNIHVHNLDLSDSRETVDFAKAFSDTNDELHALINNAGCMIHTRDLTQAGFEKNFATNTLGTYLLTTNLIPILQRTPHSRVITVTSGGMLLEKLDPNDLQFEKMNPFNGATAYSQNKRQQVVMTERYAKKYPSIHFSCMHPGWADTPSVKSALPQFYEKMKDKLRTPYQGADTAIWLAVSPAVGNIPSGLFFQDRKALDTHLPLARTHSSNEEEEKFMEKLDKLSKEIDT